MSAQEESDGDCRKRAADSRKSDHSSKKAKLVSRRKKAGFDDEVLAETTYSIRDGFRFVKPYYFTFTTHAKGRWVGSTVYDVFCREFQAESPEYYERAIKAGKVLVNGGVAGMETVIGHNDLICHLVHRHEPPVTSRPLTILQEDQDIVVVDKPASIPIHPCGRYRHNSVLFLLAKEHNLRNLHTVHRLDRLTSGLLVLAKSLLRAQQLEVQIRERRVSKEYICRVQGEFPSTPVECNEPILVFSHKLGLSRVDPEGKPCSTHFTRLSFNGETSLVKCEPKTGRMHQIRVHLQWLGHPIVNDPLYNHPAWRTAQGGGASGVGTDCDTTTKKGETSEDSKPYYERVVMEILSSKFSEAERTARREKSPASERGSREEEKSASERGRRGDERSASGRDERGEEEGGAEGGENSVSKETGGRDGLEVGAEKEEGERTVIQDGEEGIRTSDAGGKKSVIGELGESQEDSKRIDTEGRSIRSEIQESGGTDKDIEERKAVDSSEKMSTLAGGAENSYDPHCTECQLVRPLPSPDQLFMCLHALCYKGEDWSYSTPLPYWANEGWKHSVCKN